PTAVVVLGAVDQRDRAQQAEAEARVGQQPLAVEGHDYDAMGAGGRRRVAHPSQPPLDHVAQALQGGAEERAVLEAVSAPAATDELGLNRTEVDTRMLVEQDVDVVERERTNVRLMELVQCRA